MKETTIPMGKITSFLDNVIKAFASARMGFFIAFSGMLAQVAHIWFIAKGVSSFEGTWAGIQAGILSIFLGGGLMFFTVRSGWTKDDEYLENKYNRALNLLAFFEASVNLYYWADKLVFKPGFVNGEFDPTKVDWYKLFIAVLFSVSLPFILKKYAGEIQEHKRKNESPTTPEIELIQQINELRTIVQETSGSLANFTNEFLSDIKNLKKETYKQVGDNHETVLELVDNLQKKVDRLSPSLNGEIQKMPAGGHNINTGLKSN